MDRCEQEFELPELLVIHSPPVFIIHQEQFSQKFRILKTYEFPLSSELLLQTLAQSTKALLCPGKSPISSNILCHLLLYNSLSLIALGSTISTSLSANDELGGKHVGIVGLGNIGLKVATRLEAFGCKLSYNSRQKKPVPYNFYPSVCELALDCNILVICCTLNMETHHMIDKNVLTAIGKNGFLINIARGPIIDEKELVKFLVEGEIAGAGLDVFENEPKVPPELFSLDNVVLTPHRAAFTEEAFLSAFQIVLANLEAFFSNKPLISPVIHG